VEENAKSKKRKKKNIKAIVHFIVIITIKSFSKKQTEALDMCDYL